LEAMIYLAVTYSKVIFPILIFSENIHSHNFSLNFEGVNAPIHFIPMDLLMSVITTARQ